MNGSARLLIPLFGLVTACSDDVRVAQLERRVDSLAITVTALVNARRGGEPAALSESLTVSLTGAANAGAANAPVVIVEFTDYQCPFCARHFETTLREIRAQYVNTGKVRYVIRDLPLTEIHPYAAAAAKAARCAGAQGEKTYWQYHDALFTHQKQITDSFFIPLAHRIGLNLAAFQTCVGSQQTIAAIDRDQIDAQRAGLTGTPAFVIGRARSDSVRGVLIRGAYPIELFRQAIDSALGAKSVANR
jgi:protein-disulfide isomerase